MRGAEGRGICIAEGNDVGSASAVASRRLFRLFRVRWGDHGWGGVRLRQRDECGGKEWSGRRKLERRKR